MYPLLCVRSVRPLLGIEALRLQGLFFDEDLLAQFPNDFLHDLGGNTFTSTTFMNPVSALFLFFVEARRRRYGGSLMDVDDETEFKDLDGDLDGDEVFGGIPLPRGWSALGA